MRMRGVSVPADEDGNETRSEKREREAEPAWWMERQTEKAEEFVSLGI